MSDFFREVDEELRNDRMRNVWKKFAPLFIGLLVLIVAATGAYRFYIYWVDHKAGQSGDKYLQALQFIEDGDRAGANKLLSELEADGYGSYPVLARFKAAAVSYTHLTLPTKA